MQKGKLIFKLETDEEKGITIKSSSVSMILYTAFCLALYFGLTVYFTDKYREPDEVKFVFIASLCFLALIVYSIFSVFISIKKGKKSKLYMYENCIVAMAVPKSGFSTTMEEFSLCYSDIKSVSTEGAYVIIYTQWQTYKVLSFKKHNQIISIINEEKARIDREGLAPDTPVEHKLDTEPRKTQPEIRCSCGEMIYSYPCQFCGLEKPEVIPENHWKCMGCGEYISEEIEECKCGYKKS